MPVAQGWDDAAFFDRVGVMRPRNGPIGVPNMGGLTAPATRPVRPAVVQQPPVAGPAGRPAAPFAGPQAGPVMPPQAGPVVGRRPTGGVAGGTRPGGSQPGPSGAPSEVTQTFKFHPPPEPLEPAEPTPNPMGVSVQTPEGGTAMVLSPEGKSAFAGERLRAEEMFGPSPFSGDPHAPKPAVRAGKPNFNPFFGWS